MWGGRQPPPRTWGGLGGAGAPPQLRLLVLPGQYHCLFSIVSVIISFKALIVKVILVGIIACVLIIIVLVIIVGVNQAQSPPHGKQLV